MKRTPLRRKTPLRPGSKPLARRALLRRSRVKQINPVRVAKRRAQYRKVLASDFHKQLRYRAWERACGYCECAQCAQVRRIASIGGAVGSITYAIRDGVAVETSRDGLSAEAASLGVTPTPVWFTKRGKEPWQRFRSTAGEVHHIGNYKYFGQENPEEINHVLWVHRECHMRIESEHGTRRRYLNSGRG